MAETSTKKIIRKKWYPIVASKLFNDTPIGESLVTDGKDLLGRSITVNMMNLTGDIKHQSISIKFKVVEIADGKALTQLTSYEISQPSIKRFIRRNVNRLDDSFVCETADNQYVRIKPLIITKFKTTGSVLRTLRLAVKNSIAREVKKSTLENLVRSLITHRLQGAIKNATKNIYPVKVIEIKKLDTVKISKSTKVAKVHALEETPVEEEPDASEQGEILEEASEKPKRPAKKSEEENAETDDQ